MAKTLTILRGLPGAGKSWATKTLPPFAVVCSADHYFLDKEGNYNFNPTLLGQAHTACQEACLRAMARGETHIVLDNTNTRRWEFRLYLTMADIFGYKVEIIDLFDGGHADEELAARNQHGVPLDTIARMRLHYER